MTPEAPIQIDLSQDSSWDKIGDEHLTQDEKNLLKEHFTEEHEGIIYLTKQEIKDLKDTITTTVDPRWEAWGTQVLGESFNEFIKQQKSEWLALSDIVESNNDIPEIIRAQIDAGINGLEDTAKEKLFWDEGMFSSLDISDTRHWEKVCWHQGGSGWGTSCNVKS